MQQNLKTCARPWAGFASMMQAFPMTWKHPPPWVLDSAAASWAYLHLEITRERIEREFNVDIITTAPSVIYKINMRDGTQKVAAQSGGHAGRHAD